MTDSIGPLISGIALVVTALVAFAIFDALVSNPTIRTSTGLMIIQSATDAIVFAVMIGLPGGLLVIGVLRGLGG